MIQGMGLGVEEPRSRRDSPRSCLMKTLAEMLASVSGAARLRRGIIRKPFALTRMYSVAEDAA